MTVVSIVAAIFTAWIALLIVFWILRPRDVAIRELARLIPDLIRMLGAIARDSSAPLDVRLVLIALIAWIVSPIDLIPEFVPVLGPMDDVVVAIVALRYVGRRLGVDAMRGHWPGSSDGFALLARVVGLDWTP